MAPATSIAFVESHLRGTLLAAAGDAALRSLCASARHLRFEVPTQLCAAGAAPTHLYYVVEGSIALVARRAGGEEFAVGYVAQGGWATWLNCFMDVPAEHELGSSAAASLIALPVGSVRSFCAQHPQVYPAIIQHIGRRMRLVLDWTGQSAMAGPAQRMAKLLHVMALELSPGMAQATVRLTQARLASLARCSRQTANALIAELQARGLVRAAYGRYELPDLPALAAFAAGD